MKAQEQIAAIQQVLKDGGFYHGKVDGIPGAFTRAAIAECTERALSDFMESKESEPPENVDGVHEILATSFADPADIAAFKRCKLNGGSDSFCFNKGDNGIGLWGDDTTGPVPMCALPVEDWLAKWGSKANARGKKVLVKANGKEIVCELRDTMPHRANITNGAGIDLAPGAQKALGLKAPCEVRATWQWA